MTTSPEMESFLHEGLKRYADVREAVDVFEREIQDRLIRCLQEKQDWKHFEPLSGERGRGKALDSGVRTDERKIWASRASAKEKDGWVELELLWGIDREHEGVVAACARYDDGYRVTRGCRLDDPKAPVQLGKLGRWPHLYVPLDRKRIDLEDTFRLLLDEMDRALANDRA